MSEIEDRQRHKTLQKEYGTFYRAARDILFHHNPMDLDGKHNTGDYDNELDDFLARMDEAKDLESLQDVLYSVFLANFGEENCGGRERYAAPAAEIWQAYDKHRKRSVKCESPVSA